MLCIGESYAFNVPEILVYLGIFLFGLIGTWLYEKKKRDVVTG